MSLPRGLVWITGASTGIGKSAAKLLAHNGWEVAVSARNEEALKQLADSHPSIYAFPLDVTNPLQRKEVYGKIREELGPIDVLVNNAGYGVRGAVEEIEPSEFRALYDTNVLAPLELAKLVLPEMRERRDGRIIMVSSVVGRVSIPVSGLYSSSKFALEGLSDALRIELMPWNIKVILVEPGPIATEFAKVARDSSLDKLKNTSSPYSPYYKGLLKTPHFQRRVFWGPSTVGEAIVDACENPKPRVRYPVHFVAWMTPFLAKILPNSVMDKILAKRNGFDRPAKYF